MNQERSLRLLIAGAIALVSGVATGLHAGGTVVAPTAAVTTASPIATKSGLAVLQSGGNAADAAVAVALTLAVSQPHAGNLGGGGFLVYRDAESGGIWTLDFRETAPQAVDRALFAKSADAARSGALAAGVPGTLAGLDALHGRFGTRPWSELVAPAAALAREGFTPEAQLVAAIARASMREANPLAGPAAELFLESGKPRSRIVLTGLADTLDRIAARGARDFYEGELARRLVDAVRDGGGSIGDRDLRDYAPVWRAPIRIRFGSYDLYTVPPPAAGGLVIGEMLAMLAGDDLRGAPEAPARPLHLVIEAQRRAFIDRNRYLADPSSARIPYRALLSATRAEQWRQTIDVNRAVATVNLTEPTNLRPEAEHTTHFCIVDGAGNIASVTTTLGGDFGSGFIAGSLGFPLNNAIDDFTTLPGRANREQLTQGIFNQPDPARRPASSLSPTLVYRKGDPFLVIGAAGGPAIPGTVAQIFLAISVRGETLPAAIEAPRYHHQAVPEQVEYERGRAPQSVVDALNAMGHGVSARDSIAEVNAILIEPGRLTAVSDSRGGGAAGGY